MLCITPKPTFTADVQMYVPGASDLAVIKVTFKYQTPEELKAWQTKFAKEPLSLALVEVIENWQDVEDAAGKQVPYSIDNLKALLLQYHTAGENISQAYLRELLGARRKN
jgi:hypothetical protein